MTEIAKVLQASIEQQFIKTFQILQKSAAATNKKNGFSSDDALAVKLETYMATQVPAERYEQFKPLFASFRNARKGLKLALVMGELGEALEAVRKNLGADDHIPEFSTEEAEVADAIIRLMNYATDRKLRLAEAIVAKNNFNKDRKDHSKAARASANGKRF